MIDDLCTAISEALGEGDQIIVAIDANEDLRSGYAQSKLSALGLTDINLSHHGSPPQGTYNRGSAPIDGLWVSSTLMAARCGYLPHGDGPPGCDHCILWMDLPKDAVFGNNVATRKPMARLLKLQDPRIVDKFQQYFLAKAHEQHLFERAATLLEIAASGEWTQDRALEWEAIEEERLELIKKADRKCRKLRMGNVPWSPEIAKAMKLLLAWTLVRRRFTAARVNGRYVRRILTQAHIPFEVLRYPLDQVEYFYRAALKNYYTLKPLDELQSLFFYGFPLQSSVLVPFTRCSNFKQGSSPLK